MSPPLKISWFMDVKMNDVNYEAGIASEASASDVMMKSSPLKLHLRLRGRT